MQAYQGNTAEVNIDGNPNNLSSSLTATFCSSSSDVEMYDHRAKFPYASHFYSQGECSYRIVNGPNEGLYCCAPIISGKD